MVPRGASSFVRGRNAVPRVPTRAWLSFLAVGALAAAIYPFVSTAAEAGIAIGISLAAAGAIALGIVAHRPRAVAPWILLGLVQFLWVVGWVLWEAHILTHGVAPATDSPIIVPFLASYPILAVSLVLILTRRDRGSLALIDVGILFAALSMIGWVGLMFHYLENDAIPPVGRAVQVTYAVFDLMVLAVVTRVLVTSGRRHAPFVLLLASAFTLLVSDGIWNWSTQIGNYSPGSWADTGWILFAACAGAAALHPSMRVVYDPEPRSEQLFRWDRTVLLLAASLVGPTLLLFLPRIYRDVVQTGPVAAGTVFVTVLVLVRMAIVLREEEDLSASLRAQNERLREAEELTHLGSWEWDIPSNRVTWSDEAYRLWGADPTEVEPSYDLFLERIHPDDRETVRGVIERVFETGEPAQYEYRARRFDGREMAMTARAKLITDDGGNPVRMVGTTQDITKRKEAEAERERLLLAEQAARAQAEMAHRDLRGQNERLRELDRLKDTFVASVSHELRTPLTSIRGYLDLVLDGEAGPLTGEQEKFLGIVDRNADRLLRLVGDLLFVAQVDAGKLGLEIAEVDLATVLEESIDAARPYAEAKEIELAVAIEPSCRVLGDFARLAQLFDNLLTNAVKFTPRSGKVGVTASTVGVCAVVEVSDTGIGISEEDQARLFERFFRATSANEQAIPGTGLGLAIVKAIVQTHGGRIDVESEEGAGTTFHLEIPLAPSPGREPEPQQAVTA